MRPMTVHLGKAFSALLLAGGLTGAALAQGPSMSLESVQGSPGETVQMRVFVSGGVSDTSAINATVSIPSAQASLINGNITGTIAPGLTGYSYEDNSPVTGDGSVEYRFVIYPQDGASPAPFNTINQTEVAILSIPLAAGASGAVDVTLRRVFDADGRTGLVGISDSSGASVTGAGEVPAPNAARNIQGDNGQIIIVDFIGEDFRDNPTFPSNWQATQVLPQFISFLPTPDGTPNPNTSWGFSNTTGVNFEVADLGGGNGTFGFLSTGGATGDRFSSGLSAGQLVAVNWTISTNAADPNDAPKVRLRGNVDGFAQQTGYQEGRTAAERAPGDLTSTPTSADGTTQLTQLLHLPASAFNGASVGADGLLISYDTQTQELPGFKLGSAGSTYTVEQASLTPIDPASLTGENQIATFDFTTGTNGFTAIDNLAGIPATTGTTGGLSIAPGGPPVLNGGLVTSLSLATWGATGVFTPAAGKIYKVDYSLATTAPDPVNTMTGRIRISVVSGLPDLVFEAVNESGGPAADPAELPNAAGRTYTTWLLIPDSYAGAQVDVNFDGYQTGANQVGAVVLQNMTVTEYNRPAGI